MKAVVAAFNQEKVLVGDFSVIVQLQFREGSFQAQVSSICDGHGWCVDNNYVSPGHDWSESGSQDTAGVEVMPNEPEF